ncbi:MAG: undecaprenyl-phosphate glucose phosphotransferase [Candidatus Sumerlaeaceae bacterium]|nr:undecaprenyl-phosphate glucose phosphotransferase [Candidatus Sumerlaeaceae bacterium]
MRKGPAQLKWLWIFATADALAVVGGLAAAYGLRFHSGLLPVTKGYSPGEYLRILPLAVVVWLFWLNQQGLYEFRERAFNLQILKKIARADVFALMTIITVHFFERTLEYSRLVYAFVLITCFLSLAGERFLLDRLLAWLRKKGKLPATRVAILGTGQLAQHLAARISGHGLLGMQLVGLIRGKGAEDGSMAPECLAQLPILGSFSELRELIRQHNIEEIIAAQPDVPAEELLDFILECEKQLVRIRVVPGVLEAMLVEMSVEQIDGIPLFGLKETPLRGWNLVLKRAFDILVSATVLVLASPLMGIIAVAIKLTSPGPVFYRQKRVGLDGRSFTMIKFRSMVVDAEKETGPVWARPDDPRVTRVGRFLRRWNLDELPQFWNVLCGDMSLVGPRPERPHFVEQFRESIPRYMARHRVKCGLTGWAQVNGLRGQTPIKERIEYDLFYVENWSFWFDLKILLLTLFARKNAY